MKNELNKWLSVGGSTDSELVVKVIEEMEDQWRRAEILELCNSVRTKCILSASESKKMARAYVDTIEIMFLEDGFGINKKEFEMILWRLKMVEHSLFNRSYSSRGDFK